MYQTLTGWYSYHVVKSIYHMNLTEGVGSSWDSRIRTLGARTPDLS